jgi:hypothetical protein
MERFSAPNEIRGAKSALQLLSNISDAMDVGV